MKYGPQLLGRHPSKPDARDFALEDFLVDDGSLRDQAVALLKRTIRGYNDSRYANPPTTGSNWGKAFALLAQVGGSPPPSPISDVVWTDADPVLDQGQTGTCVGNGWAQWGNTLPMDDRFAEADARKIYLEATTFDYGSPDTTLQKGSEVRSGAKAMQNRGRLSAYAFASTLDAITTWVQAKGPLVIGSDWTNDMFNTDGNGYVSPTGSVAGGHCYLLIGNLAAADAFLFLNSWGASWGDNGAFRMKKTDFAELFANQGEACASLELPL